VKRVYLEGYKARFDLPANDTKPWYTLWEFVAQEDLTLIGAEMTCELDSIIEVDGYAMGQFKLMVNGVLDILHGSLMSYWKSVVAAAEHHSFENMNRDVMFPTGYGITLKEGESVQVLAEKVSTKASGSDTQTLFGVVLYLVKGV